MGRMIILLLLGSIGIFGLVSINVNKSTTDATKNAADYYKDVNARNIANSMIQMLHNKLSDSTEYRVNSTLEKSMFDGTAAYRVVDTVFAGDTLVKIQVTSTYLGVTRTATSYVKVTSSGTTTPPPAFMKYAVMSNGNLNLNGNITLTDYNNNNWNANIHTNGNFEMSGNNSIDGFLSYVGNATSNPPSRLNTNIHPNQNPEELPNRSQVSHIDMPTFNPDSYLSIATDIFMGNKSYSGSISLGTQENPKIIYISGNLTISGTVSGYGMFIVKGNVTATGNVTVSSPDVNVNNIGIYTSGNLTVRGNVTLNSQIYANGNVDMGGNSKVYGGVTAKGNVEFGGNCQVYYKPTNVNLTEQIWNTTTSAVTQVTKTYHYE
ncbi:MAG: FapA family protein [Bacteroidetes bacterium]|nr:FapA family protein [Bacteroidota bacterium]